MKILVTGGAGFIGSHLVNRLIDKGNRVTVLDNLERGDINFLKPSDNLKFRLCDLRNYKDIKKYFKNQDIVIHLASKVGGIGTYLSKPYDIMQSNIQIDSNVLKCIIEHGITKYFYASSAHVYPKELQTTIDSPNIKESDTYPANPELTYGWAKLIGEKAIEAATVENKNLNAAIARFIGIYGPNQDYKLETGSVIPVFSHRAIKYPETPFNVWGTGKETRSYCFINDALDCIETMILDLDNRQLVGPYNVGKDERVSIEKIASTIIDISQKEITINWDTTKDTVIWGQLCDCSLIYKELGWRSKTSLKDGLKIVYNDIKKRLNNEKEIFTNIK
jgi:GDP-D-mannose 3', 5'-epimerase